jgi:hypothetical protein
MAHTFSPCAAFCITIWDMVTEISVVLVHHHADVYAGLG